MKKKLKHNDIPGILLRPCSTTLAGNKKTIYSSKFAVKEDFYEKYRLHIIGAEIVAECAKIFIVENYKKVKDWSDLSVVMEDANTLDGPVNEHNGGKPLKNYVEYFKYVPSVTKLERRSDALDRILKTWQKRDRLRHNPARKVTGVVLDTTDGDLSMKINGRSHLWISDTTTIIIAAYIEKAIAAQKKKK